MPPYRRCLRGGVGAVRRIGLGRADLLQERGRVSREERLVLPVCPRTCLGGREILAYSAKRGEVLVLPSGVG